MGQSESKNIAKVIAEVGTEISNTVSVTQTSIDQIDSDFNLKNCFISGSVDFRNVGDIIGSNRQIVKAMQNVDVTNEIAQIINQKAIAVTKPLKFGHVKSMQVVSRFASQSVNIVNIINDISNRSSYQRGGFDCTSQFIIGDVRVGYNSREEFWQDQMGNYNQTEVVANKILQNLTQETGKEIGGISGTAVLTILIVCLSVVIMAYPASGIVANYRGWFIGIICLGIIALPIILYVSKIYPFYFKKSYCAPDSGLIKAKLCEECKNIETDTFSLDAPPLRYMNNIFYDKNDKDLPFGLLNMVISSLCNGRTCVNYNQGYNAQGWFVSGNVNNRELWVYDTNPPNGLPPLPNPLTVPRACDGNNYCMIPQEYNNIKDESITESYTPIVYSPDLKKDKDICFNKSYVQSNVNLHDPDKQYDQGRLNTMAVPNIDGWKDYIKKYGEMGALHARFVLVDYLGYDTTVYINDNEEVRLADGTKGIAKDHKDKLYKFTNFDTPTSWDKRITSGGDITGPLGTCVDREYKIGNAFQTYMNWILISIILLTVIGLIYFAISSEHRSNVY